MIRGWCPDAWRPMMAGDGLLVRIRPRLSRLTRADLLALCEAAETHGNGAIDLTNRANLQLRGLTGTSWPALLSDLQRHQLIDADPAHEARRNILTAPDWRPGDDTHGIATALLRRLPDLPDLPPKMGLAIDAGSAPILTHTPADFRVERSATGPLILRAEGHATGTAITANEAPDALIALTHWFLASGGADARRMARHTAPLPTWATGTLTPAPTRTPPPPSPHVRGIPFGRTDARELAAFLHASEAQALRLTPWRRIILEDGRDDAPGFLTAPSPLLAVDACPGAPACPQASVETRALATRLAPLVPGTLHVSGCAKHCARPRTHAADTILTGRNGRFDLAHPPRSGLSPDQVLALFGPA